MSEASSKTIESLKMREGTRDQKSTKKYTLPETNSSPLKLGLPKRKGLPSNHVFSGAAC